MARISKLNRIFNRIELNYTNLTNQIVNWLSYAYQKSNIVFSQSSPYGQILLVVRELFIQNILYLKNFVKQLDIDQSNSVRMISNIARISGHNSSRAISAKGTLLFKLKQGINIDKTVSGGLVIIYDETTVRNNTNSLYYSLKTGTYRNYYPLTPGCQFFVNIVQGQYESQTFTGDGTISQSIQVTVSNNSVIDNFDYQVSLNGIILAIKDHLYDLLQDEYACYTRTGFNGGLDVYFGNSTYGIIPAIGSIIEVKYLLNNGLQGNILNNKVNDFTFVGDIYDDNGNTLQADQIFDIFVQTDIIFASDGETLEYTKSVIPYVSRNFILATPSQFIYHLMKLNMFSKVNAFNQLDMVKIDINSDGTLDNININLMYLYLIPRITDYFSTNVNYFNVPYNNFYLNSVDKDRIISYLKIDGILSITSAISIIDPIIRKFIINIFVIRYQDVSEDNIKQQIISSLSTYFSTYSRYDRIVKSDLITNLKNNIDGIDSINISFVGQQNEDYHRDGGLLSASAQNILQSTYVANSNSVNVPANNYRNVVTNQQNQTQSNVATSSNAPNINLSTAISSTNSNSSTLSVGNSTIVSYKNTTTYDPTQLLGIDPVLGDIIISKNELVVLRGGWSDRNGIFFNEDPTISTGFSTVNIIWKGVTQVTPA